MVQLHFECYAPFWSPQYKMDIKVHAVHATSCSSIICFGQSVAFIFRKIQFRNKKAILWLLGFTYISFSNDDDCFLWLFILYPLCGLQKYEQELFKLALPCLSAVAGALPPDYMESNYVNMMEKQSSMDSDGNFNPQPVDTSK